MALSLTAGASISHGGSAVLRATVMRCVNCTSGDAGANYGAACTTSGALMLPWFNAGTITTSGTGSAGIVAQSIGGGGGHGGYAVSLSGTEAAAFSLAVGGSGGASGNAGNVFAGTGGVNMSPMARIRPASWRSRSAAAAAMPGPASPAACLRVPPSLWRWGPRAAPAAMAPRPPAVNQGSTIITTGDRSPGLLAQSIGGGGGNGGAAVSAARAKGRR